MRYIDQIRIMADCSCTNRVAILTKVFKKAIEDAAAIGGKYETTILGGYVMHNCGFWPSYEEIISATEQIALLGFEVNVIETNEGPYVGPGSRIYRMRANVKWYWPPSTST